jgi:hypothetical protein
MNSSQPLRKLVRLWVVANLCSLVAVYGPLTPHIESWAEARGFIAFLLWDTLPLCAMVWLLRPRAQNAPPNHPLQLIILAFCAWWTGMVVIAICRRPGSMVGLTLAFMPLYQWLGVLVAILLRRPKSR